MRITNTNYILELNESNGAICSMKNTKGKEFICYAESRTLATFTFIDEKNEFIRIDTNDGKFSVVKAEAEETLLRYENIGGKKLSALVKIRHPQNESMTYWSMEVQNESGLHLDKIDFPKVVVPNDLIATGGNGRVFTSMMEGLLVEDAEIREWTGVGRKTDGLETGWGGKYPGACTTQFSAYYSDEGGLYFAAHDSYWNPKIIEYYKEDGGIKLEFKLHPGVDDTRAFAMEYEMVLGVFEGNWYDAAEIYRSFIEACGLIKLPKLKDNKNIPAWLKEDPIIICYPVRGQVDTALDENCQEEYYPYTKATPYMKELHESLDSAVMPLLMHWEGTAPWAPPYVWPPYGDFEDFQRFVDELHESGNYLGLYCSGISWTQQSCLVPDYNKEEEFEKENWKDAILVGPNQTTDFTWKWIRYSYELCPACEKTKNVAIKEFEKIVTGCDVDYVQFFDQNLGGAAYACYSKSHGHTFGPGKWKNEEMLKIADGMHDVLKKYDKEDKILIGCEGNAAEPFVNHFIFNDSRHNINYQAGNPVAAYNYIFHEYVCNFMGNQNTSFGVKDLTQCPDNIYYRYAHSFAQGDILTIVLKDKGQIHWDWCTPWDAPEIDQKAIRKYIGGLNAWRKNIAKDALLYGRMIKPLPYDCEKYVEGVIRKKWKPDPHDAEKNVLVVEPGGNHYFDAVESSCYEVEGGKKKQIFVNYLSYDQTITLKSDKAMKLYEDPKGVTVSALNGKEKKITIPARSVRMVEFE